MKLSVSKLEKGILYKPWIGEIPAEDDLRGAMADYDQVIWMDSQNLIARFNRGLLRFRLEITTGQSGTLML